MVTYGEDAQGCQIQLFVLEPTADISDGDIIEVN